MNDSTTQPSGDMDAGEGTPNPKLQRWVDLVASLLARKFPATFTQLAADVPAYANELAETERLPAGAERTRRRESLKREFERDKDELRKFGIPIVPVADEDGNAGGAYRLERRDFYLPYLCCAVPDAPATAPPRVDAYGYHALAALTFEADELQAVVDAAALVRTLGDPMLALEAEGAMRKLAIDLPLDAMAPSAGEPHIVAARTRPDAATFEALGDALRRRKRVSFEYHAMSTDRAERRTVEPYGLFFLSGHWYLAARDCGRQELRNFRLNRMSAVSVNGQRTQRADYEIPATFRLRDHGRSRHAWELGDGDALTVDVAFRGESGPTVAAMKLGSDVPGAGDQRRFTVRRADVFARWLLSFGGELAPVAPASMVEAFRTLARETCTLYGRPSPDPLPAPTAMPPAATPRRARAVEPWSATGAVAQFRRILLLVPQIANGEEHDVEEVARRIGTTVAVLQKDLFSLVTRYDAPAGFVDGVSAYVENGRVSARSDHFLRPMRLTVPELCALELGLAVLRTQRPPDERGALDRARDRLRQVIAKLPSDTIPDGVHGASLGEATHTEHLAALRRAMRDQRTLRLVYRRSGSETPGQRVIHPYMFVASSGMLYAIAHCETSNAIRVFRLDRIESAMVGDETFERPREIDVGRVLQDGRVLQHDGMRTMRIRYSPRIARWIAERERRVLAADESLVMDHPLADEAWGIRHVLQYGPDAELLAPAAMRDMLRQRLSALTES
ncbi:MAG: WYL domain-containing protein [Gemmatimonadaceae bacterium]|nr:WYL domain-containing protein [Gemmatimonadaceae bacterium]